MLACAQMMDARELERLRLEFFADVAQTEDLEALSTGERTVLLERFERFFPEARTEPVDALHRGELGLHPEASIDDVVWARLRDLHAIAQERIVAVVDGGYVHTTDSFSWSAERNRWEVVRPVAREGACSS